jgi:hypothetical protein
MARNLYDVWGGHGSSSTVRRRRLIPQTGGPWTRGALDAPRGWTPAPRLFASAPVEPLVWAAQDFGGRLSRQSPVAGLTQGSWDE